MSFEIEYFHERVLHEIELWPVDVLAVPRCASAASGGSGRDCIEHLAMAAFGSESFRGLYGLPRELRGSLSTLLRQMLSIRRERSRRSCLIEGSISASGREPSFKMCEPLSAIGGEADFKWVLSSMDWEAFAN